MATHPSFDKSRVNLEKAVVVVLESNEQGLVILRQVFAGFGVRNPRRCKTPAEAWEIINSLEVDLIVCGSLDTDGGAYDFVRELRRSGQDPNRYAPVIVVSGHTPSSLVRKARDCGANFVIAKPLSPRVLMERIVWIAKDARASIEAGAYIGPDRRFQNLGPPGDIPGRRREDANLSANSDRSEGAMLNGDTP